jgi:DNA/RNA-binding domain of Phe-tRNA-synthetase-like protein
MYIRLDRTLLAQHPHMVVSGIVAYGLDTAALAGPAAAEWPAVDAERAAAVVADWKRQHKVLSADKNARSSIAYLVKAAARGSLRRIHPLVDLYNHASLRCLGPFGGEDISCLAGGLELRCAMGDEVFRPLGHAEEIEHPGPGEVAWFDGAGRVVCRALNWLESDLHKITADTRDVVFVSERPSPAFPDPESGMEWLAARLVPHCDRLIRTRVDAATPVFDAGA